MKLTDDGDRYRLARRCGLILDFDACEVRFYVGEEVAPRTLKWTPCNDREEAEAIVRAAASIAAASEAAEGKA